MAKIKNPKLVRFSNDTFGVRCKIDTEFAYVSQLGSTMYMPTDPENSADWDVFEMLYMMSETDARSILALMSNVDEKVVARKSIKVEVID